MKLENLLNIDELNKQIREGFINERRHPALPLRILNYSNRCTFENHWSLEACICRGLIVDDAGVIVSRPPSKFFNLNQRGPHIFRNNQGELEVQDETFTPEFLLGQAKMWRSPITITRKLDGWAGISWHYEGIYGVASRGSFDSPGAQYATEKVQKFVKYRAFADFLPEDTTLFFEIISKITKVVVPYNFEGLVLIAAIANETGEELEYPELEAFHKQLNSYAKDRDWCRLVPKFDMSVEECMADKDMTEEGYVAAVYRPHFPPVRAKVKLAEYCRIHRIVTGVTPQKIWQEMHNPMSPWLDHNSKLNHNTGEVLYDLSVPRDFAKWVKGWQMGLYKAFHDKLLQALKAQKAYNELERGIYPEHRNRLHYLHGCFPVDIVNAAIKLENGNIVGAYEILWKMVRPYGREETYYFDGKGE
jgi:RNA ligase